MRKTILLVTYLALGLMLAACGPKQNGLDIGHAMVQEGNCAGASPYLQETIVSPDNLEDLAHAYYLKGECARQTGDAAKAYENYFAAKRVGAYIVAHDTHINLNTYGRSEFVEEIIPKKLAALVPDIGEAKVKDIKAKVNASLEERYLKEIMRSSQ